MIEPRVNFTVYCLSVQMDARIKYNLPNLWVAMQCNVQFGFLPQFPRVEVRVSPGRGGGLHRLQGGRARLHALHRLHGH